MSSTLKSNFVVSLSSYKVNTEVVLPTVSLACKYCNNTCKKSGIRNGNQQFKCSICHKYQRQQYRYNAYNISDNTIINLTKEGVGIRSTSRLLKISTSTLIHRIKKIAKTLNPNAIYKQNLTYQADELKTFILRKSRDIWVSYALCTETKEIISLVVGSRTIKRLKTVIDSILPRSPKQILTDKLLTPMTWTQEGI